MKKVMMTLLLAAATFASAQAQTERVGKWSLTPSVGVNCSNVMNMNLAIGLSGNDIIESKVKYGLVVGADAAYRFSSKFAFSAGLYYSDEGYRYSSYKDFGGMTQSWKFMSMPLMFRFFPEKYDVSVNVGLQPGYLLDYDKANNGSLKRFNLSVPLGVSCYVYGPLVLDIEVYFGLLNLNDNAFLNDKWRVNGGRLTLGYSFDL